MLIAAYDYFISHEIDPGESKTRVYLRGKASIKGGAVPVKTDVTLKAFPNELIPWPQAWADVPDIAQATLEASKDGQGSLYSRMIQFGSCLMLAGLRSFYSHRDGSPGRLQPHQRTWKA